MDRSSELLGGLQAAILNYEEEEANDLVREILELKIDPLVVMNETIAETARMVGEKYQSGEIYLPHLVMAGDIMAAVSAALEAALPVEAADGLDAKVIVVGTVESDIHSIGKNIVAMLLQANGYKVFDLGVDVKSIQFIEQARMQKADIIALSSLLTTTMGFQKEVIDILKSTDSRDQYRVIVGGGTVTQSWADEIGADGYGKDAIHAVAVAKALEAGEPG